MYSNTELPKRSFMGFGYNPDLKFFGERLDILYYFSWMKQLKEIEWFVWDASSYYIVNATPRKKVDKLGERPTGENILEVLISEQERPKRKEIIQNCELRSTYLKDIIKYLGINAQYLDSRLAFRAQEGKKCFARALDLALEYTEKLKRDNPELLKKISPNNQNPASQLYLPLEIAEALYLSNIYGVESKFGPRTEEFFDKCILGLQEEREVPYKTIWCQSGPRRAGYLGDKNVIWGSTPLWNADETVLRKDNEYSKFVEGYTSSFRYPGESLIECVQRLQRILGVK